MPIDLDQYGDSPKPSRLSSGQGDALALIRGEVEAMVHQASRQSQREQARHLIQQGLIQYQQQQEDRLYQEILDLGAVEIAQLVADIAHELQGNAPTVTLLGGGL